MDIKDDFYKRFLREGGMAEDFFIPCTVPLIGGWENSSATVTLNLSFGTHIAVRHRTDGRITIADSLSDIDYESNFSDLSVMDFPKWVKDIISSANKIPKTENGFEMLICSDIFSSFFESRILSAKKALKEVFAPEISDISLLNSEPFYRIAPFLPAALVAVNSLTLEVLTYPFTQKNTKAVIVLTSPQKLSVPDGFLFKERNRLKKFSSAVDLFPLMQESRTDLAYSIKHSDIESLVNSAADFTEDFNILPAFSGIVAFLEDGKIDSFIEVLTSRHEKKTGEKPAFYISDIETE
ncbi:MAG: hypothetical protein Q4B31_05165 [Clostridia bacterium]|nr:hypothetical protein [Clostridia bacterium]